MRGGVEPPRGRQVPSVDGKHHQVRDEFRSRGAIELSATDEAAKGTEHLGVENRGRLEGQPGVAWSGCRGAAEGAAAM
jgi:hypothetical protein